MPYVVKISGPRYNGYLRGDNRNVHNKKGLTDDLQLARLFRRRGVAEKYIEYSTDAHPVEVLEVEIRCKIS